MRIKKINLIVSLSLIVSTLYDFGSGKREEKPNIGFSDQEFEDVPLVYSNRLVEYGYPEEYRESSWGSKLLGKLSPARIFQWGKSVAQKTIDDGSIRVFPSAARGDTDLVMESPSSNYGEGYGWGGYGSNGYHGGWESYGASAGHYENYGGGGWSSHGKGYSGFGGDYGKGTHYSGGSGYKSTGHKHSGSGKKGFFNRSAVGLLGFLSLLSLIQTALNQTSMARSLDSNQWNGKMSYYLDTFAFPKVSSLTSNTSEVMST